MRIYQLFHALIEKFVPMDKSTQDDLQLEAVKFYNEALEEKNHIQKSNLEILQENTRGFDIEGYDKKPLKALTFKHTIIGFLDQWYMRYLNALLFIYLVPKIKSFIAGDSQDEDEDEDEENSEQGEFAKYMEFRRFQKSML